jgi:hypothetical protein
MSAFKDIIHNDCSDVFLNIEEFSDEHIINGQTLKCQVDDYEQISREKRYQYNRSLHGDGIYLKEVMIYVLADEFNKHFNSLPAVGRTLILDGRKYLVSDAQDEYGIYSISLGSNET